MIEYQIYFEKLLSLITSFSIRTKSNKIRIVHKHIQHIIV
jgi:hypothetical protein